MKSNQENSIDYAMRIVFYLFIQILYLLYVLTDIALGVVGIALAKKSFIA